MTASQAYQKSKKKALEISNGEYQTVLNIIQNAVDHACLFCVVDGQLSDWVKEKLVLDGFELSKIQSGYDSFSWKISWENAWKAEPLKD